MGDIVKRLRSELTAALSPHQRQLIADAADEIERLRLEVAKSIKQYKQLGKIVDDGADEIERLRGMLSTAVPGEFHRSEIERLLENLDRATRARGQRVAE